MSESLEIILATVCKSVDKGSQSNQQTLYSLTDAKDAKLAYDVLVACGVEAKYYPDDANAGAKLYVQTASLPASQTKLQAIIAQATLLKDIKALIDSHSEMANYTLSFANTAVGSQLTLILPPDKHAKMPPQPKTLPSASQSKITSTAVNMRAQRKEEETLAAGPSVARAALPKSFKTSDTEEDPLSKRILFYLSGHAFTSMAWTAFILLLLGVIFSILVSIRGFMCPDVAKNARDLPAYCPRKVEAPRDPTQPDPNHQQQPVQ